MIESFTTASFSLLNLAMFFGLLAWGTAFYILWQQLDRTLGQTRLLLAFTASKMVYPLYIFLTYDPLSAGWLYGLGSPTALILMVLIPCLFVEGVLTCMLLNRFSPRPVRTRWLLGVPAVVIAVMLLVSVGYWFVFQPDPFGIAQTRHNEQLPRVARDLARILSNSVYSNAILALVGLYLLRGASLAKLFGDRGGSEARSRWVERFFYAYLLIVLLNGLSYILDIRGFLSSNIVLSINFVALSLTHLAAFVWLALVAFAVLINRTQPSTSAASQQRDRYLSEPYVRQVQTYLAEHQPYLQSALSIERLAQDMAVPTKALSIIINNVYDCSFSEFIAQQRLQYAKKLLTSSPELKVEDVATASGFNSRSSFFSVFKKAEGCTPSAYRKQQRAI